uniref:inner centromere protein-like n=1 Tax=Osmia lignaria TaxID=473952 RepID=UPI001478C042|nr:inner centromere protein-like [Osmia lignaria]
MEKKKWDNRYEVLQPESDPEYGELEYTFGYGELEEAAIKKVSKMEQRANRQLIDQLRKRREEEFLSELLSLIADRGFEKEVEQHLRKKKYGKKQSEEEEYREWNTPQRSPWDIPIPAKTQAKIDRKKALYAAREEEKRKQQEEWESGLPGPSYARRERERVQAEAEREEERCLQRLREMKKGPLGWVFRQDNEGEPDKEL